MFTDIIPGMSDIELITIALAVFAIVQMILTQKNVSAARDSVRATEHIARATNKLIELTTQNVTAARERLTLRRIMSMRYTN